ncbi:24-hydroxycholesterol 7-alpha-hydroxylase [Pelobates cultripes]|uniref:24-hydroxycholesterol 7-alpha-hydroxylase n=1 Tax=Pelobates cultripes TaxID=61616 RepID=A0AAD1RAC1_PELCU|nr:24-hydroxycholesterol 7-alpha-hydroxylase [Pelobates cultripes]CAH2245791.1 24-hydroxycholesterol 7-alpha-hydroxylase [Pelobates cultripes]
MGDLLSAVTTAALGLLLALLTGLLIRHLLTKQSRSLPPPPCIRGWIPWLGAALEMGKAPLEFIERAREKHGPVFTVLAAGNRLTFVNGEEGVTAFFTSKKLDFQQAVQKPVQYTASIEKENFFKKHSAIHETLKLQLSQKRLEPHVTCLCREFSSHLQQLGSQGTDELYSLVRQVMYPAYGSQLPECFLRDWSRSKQWLLKLFKTIVAEVEGREPCEDDAKTLHQHLLDTLKGVSTYNNSLLLLWASQANANPITFWTLAFIISNPVIYKYAMDEISSVFGEAGKKTLSITEADLRKLPFIKHCILEAIRLRSPGAITRKVIEPLEIYNFQIPPGDMLMLSPYWLHRDPKKFPEPEAFRPERWKKANLEKNVFLDGFVAFGGGKYQCPGRWFALMEIHMLVILMLYRYEFQLLDPFPKQSNLHLVGTQQPDGPCRVTYKLRE